MILGIGILDYGIITEIDGIGRFAIILFGTLFSVASCLVSFDKKGKQSSKQERYKMCNNIGYYFYIIDSIKYSMKNTI